ncbi:hypothetical protein TNCV_1021421 [Trichonephila clavipes]|uniref:Uncharacterized protein n=1 Tax=Trichonephila clavipes TaxID=2585209 RepID=A0A8X6VDH2_TRICX|nr:hypothetical protein TNCV_1021421 [Trichonephila clavipes]
MHSSDPYHKNRNVHRKPWTSWTVAKLSLVQDKFHAEIVEEEIGGVAIYRPFGEFRRAQSYCHLYGAQGQRQAYFLPLATMNFVGLDLTTSDRWH